LLDNGSQDASASRRSFVAKYEGGERRLDVIEFIMIARAIGADPMRILRAFIKKTA
jgi:hypothetical protein